MGSMGKCVLSFTCPECQACFGWEVDYETYVDAIEKDKLLNAKCYSCGHTIKYSPRKIKEESLAKNKAAKNNKKGFFSKLFGKKS